jgi:hypothetical protein
MGLAAIAIALMAVSPAQADWSRPVLIADGYAWGPQVTAASGRATVTWSNTSAGTLWARQLRDRRTLTRTRRVSGTSRLAEGAWGEQVARTPDGGTLVVWFASAGPNRSSILARRVGPRGGLGRVRTVASPKHVSSPGAMATAGGGDVSVAIARSGHAWMTWAKVEGTPVYRGFDVSSSTVLARRLGRDGSLGPIVQLGPATEFGPSPRVAVKRSGAAVVVWPIDDAGGPTLQYVTISRHRPAGRSRSLSGPDAFELQLVSNDRGDALALWRTGGTTIARLLGRNNRLGPTRAIASDHYGPLEAVVDSSGTATIVWNQSLSRLGDTRRLALRQLHRDGRLGPRRWLSGVHRESADAALAVGPDRDVTAVWPGPAGGGRTVWARRIAPSGALSTPRRLIRSTSDLVAQAQVATAPDGVTTAVWYRLVSLDYRRIQAVRFTPTR